MIQAIRITQYRASDGAVFSSRDEAHKHETKIAIMRVIWETVRGQLAEEERGAIAAALLAPSSPVLPMLKAKKGG